MGIVVIGAVFVDIKGFPNDLYIPDGRNAGRVEYVYGGVSRNVVEDIANIELRPTFLSIVDDSGIGMDVMHQLEDHKVNTQYMKVVSGGMGTWLAVFDSKGDLAGSISQRPNLMPILDVLEEHGDEIFHDADSIVVEIDMDKKIVKKTMELASKYHKKMYGVVSNMSIAMKRRDLMQQLDCIVCNQLEAGIFFSEEYQGMTPEELLVVIEKRCQAANIHSMVVTMGERGCVYYSAHEKGCYPARKVHVKDTTGAGDAFFSGVAMGLTYGLTLKESCEVGTRLSASVITSSENVCPRFLPAELGLSVPKM